MGALIQRIQAREPVFQDTGTVLSVDGDRFIVAASDERFEASRALSCLVEPEVDDEVLLAGRRSGDVYILAVLSRAEGSATRVRANGDVTFQVSQGSFAVVAEKGVNIVSSDDVQLTTTKAFKLRAAEGQLFIDKLSYLGQKVIAEVAQAKTFVGALDQVADRFVQRVKRAYRFVEELDQLRAEYVDHGARKNLRLRARNALMTAEDLVKIDGDQIHLG